MATAVEIGTLIDCDPNIRGGRPKIAGTGITVSRIVGWYKIGYSAENIVMDYPHLTLAQVHAALAYYHANQRTVDEDMAREEAIADQFEREMGLTNR